MRVLINALAVFGGGAKTHLANLIPHFGFLGHKHEFVLLYSSWQRELPDLPANFTRLVAGPKRRSPLLRVLWEQIGIPALIRREHIDVIYLPTPATALFCPRPTVVDVRDSNIFSTVASKHWRYLTRNWVLRLMTWLVVKRAAHVIFVSRHSRDTALRVLKFDPRKAAVVYHGIGPHFFKPAQKATAGLFNRPRPYVLTVSTIQTHKNYLRLMDAFAQLCRDPSFSYDYVFAGAIGSQLEFERVQERISQPDLKGRVHYLGEVPYQDLPALYQRASLFVLPSLLETFGLTLVEAMASGIPIAASNISAIPEIAGDAAVYFDPYSVGDIADILRNVLQDKELRERLVIAGRKRASNFSWATAAQEMLDLLEAAVCAK